MDAKYINDNELDSFYGDKRILDLLKYNKKDKFSCIYCFEKADSREHIPSKIFLDEPYPETLAVLPACKKCNNSFSANEQYLACLIDYIQYKLCNKDDIKREKIRKTFQKRPKIKELFERNTVYKEGGELEYIEYDNKQIEEVLIKLAKGHAIYSLSHIGLEIPSAINFMFLTELSEEQYINFNSCVKLEVIPELGSRECFICVTEDGTPIADWKVVQENQYRYLAFEHKAGVCVRIVIGEFFYAEIVWEEKSLSYDYSRQDK